ncbi:MAG TPA: hypothetical protein VK611_21620 [Acidimicrobiales bacterium]|nr:hypothetical protein [Acidimicrobiales bacterium]
MGTNRAGSGPIARALAKALRAATVDDRDAATVALAKRLAALLDESAPRSAYEEHLLKVARAVASCDEPDDEVDRALRKIADALGRHSVASDLGPKYLATLTALGLTPAARGTKEGGQVVSGPSKLDELRARRGPGTG